MPPTAVATSGTPACSASWAISGAGLPAAGQHHEVGCGEQFRHVVAAAEQHDRQPLGVDPALQRGAVVALAGDGDQW